MLADVCQMLPQGESTGLAIENDVLLARVLSSSPEIPIRKDSEHMRRRNDHESILHTRTQFSDWRTLKIEASFCRKLLGGRSGYFFDTK